VGTTAATCYHRQMLRARLVLVVAALGAPAAAAPPRPGKIVRVERVVRRFAGDPRFCAVNLTDLSGLCFGARPEVDQRIAIVDAHHVLGTVRVTGAEVVGSCKDRTANLWAVHVEAVGDLATDADSRVTGLLDVPIDRRDSRVLAVDHPPAARSGATDQLVGVDVDGDGQVDLEFVPFACDDRGAPATSGATSQCLDVWAAVDGHALQLVRTDRLPQGCI